VFDCEFGFLPNVLESTVDVRVVQRYLEIQNDFFMSFVSFFIFSPSSCFSVFFFLRVLIFLSLHNLLGHPFVFVVLVFICVFSISPSHPSFLLFPFPLKIASNDNSANDKVTAKNVVTTVARAMGWVSLSTLPPGPLDESFRYCS